MCISWHMLPFTRDKTVILLPRMSSFTPLKILSFLAVSFILLGLLSWVFPEEGIAVGDHVKIKFPTLTDIFLEAEPEADIASIVDMEVAAPEEDTIEVQEQIIDYSKVHGALPLDSGITITEYISMQQTGALDNFFYALRNSAAEGNSVRIMHYGDSQIEVDRITGYIRSRLQSHFGGSGVGLLNIMPVAEGMAFNTTYSSNWERYTAFTRKDKRVLHKAYGPMIAFSRYAPVVDTNSELGGQQEAWLKFINTKRAGARASNFTKLYLLYGNSMSPVAINVWADGVQVAADTLATDGFLHTYTVQLPQAPVEVQYNFKGKDSPDIYGVSFEGATGVIMDNIPLRGSSGDFFTGMQSGQLKSFYQQAGVDLFLLQFGGNTIPYLKDSLHAQSYARSIGAQIRHLKNMRPEADIIFIGPSDMSIKDGANYVTHPLIEPLNNALRKEVEAAGAAYYDMYAAMGGRNSMVAWVNAGLAGADYTHFSPEGARKIAVLFYQALIIEYNNYIIRNS